MMVTHCHRRNLNLLAAVALALLCGCRSGDRGRHTVLSTLRAHLEGSPDGTNLVQPVPIGRDKPVLLNVERLPFLTEEHVSEARMIEAVGGPAIRVQLNHRGTLLLEVYTVANHGRRIAIFSQFVSPLDPEATQSRWLAAPMISHKISDGILLFTPDASREEIRQIVFGLNNVAKRNENAPGQQQG